jgi:SAM-dependent methyltransferase
LTNQKSRGSYTSCDKNFDLFVSLWRLRTNLSKHQANLSESVGIGIREAHDAISAIDAQGLKLQGRRILDIGAGQLPRHMPVFALENEVVCIDNDVVPCGLDFRGYWRMWRENGLKRLLKTLGRKATGYDQTFKREFTKQLGLSRLPAARLLSMDATCMDLPAESFDCIYSFNVFEHLPNVGAVVRECARILKPGGVFYTYLHPVTAEDGYHDLRVLAGHRDGIPLWAHLRPAHRPVVQPCAYINGLRIEQYVATFTAELGPCAISTTRQPHHDRLVEELADLRSAGELEGYSDEELLCRRLVLVWRKPARAGSTTIPSAAAEN